MQSVIQTVGAKSAITMQRSSPILMLSRIDLRCSVLVFFWDVIG